MAVDYEYTEVLTFTFTPETKATPLLGDESTEAGQVWAATLKAYLDHELVGIVYWALMIEQPHQTKLFIEWKTAAARDKFEASPDAAAMHESWRSVFAAPVHVAAYRWPFPAVARETALSSSYDTVSVLFTWHFSNDNMIDEKTWTESFDPFRRAVMTSPVGGIFDYCIAGWHLDRWTFAAVFHCHSVDSTKKWLETKDVREVLDVTRTRGGARDLSIEYMETKVYKEGWCGSVRKERPDNPQVAAMFARFQQGKGRIFGQ